MIGRCSTFIAMQTPKTLTRFPQKSKQEQESLRDVMVELMSSPTVTKKSLRPGSRGIMCFRSFEIRGTSKTTRQDEKGPKGTQKKSKRAKSKRRKYDI